MNPRNACPWMTYFLVPFPRREGFSPYRSPGLLVHIPVILLSLGVGMVLWQGRVSFSILGIFFFIGLYAGRDIAILAHYIPALGLAIWGTSALCLFGAPVIVAWTASINRVVPAAPWVLTGLVTVGFAANAWSRCRGS